ncbi:MAG: hypothetical protein E6K70_26480 [Planctomycetota bacterium]|nr:MAG: hypothetical protein E6K70_26480 [Planctomycetota bacterium]
MTNEDVETRATRLRAAPRHVKAASGYATLVGILILLRGCASAYAGQLPYGKVLLYGCLALGLFWYCGMSLLDRSRWGFVALVGLAALPLLGVFAAGVHLLRLLIEGQAGPQLGDALVGATGLGQLLVTCILFRHLFAAETRSYVWKRPP